MTASDPTGLPYPRILVALDAAGGRRALATAIAAATERSMLTLLASVPRPHPLAALSGYSPDALLREAEHECAEHLRAAAGLVPAHVGVRTVLRHGALARVVAAEASARRHDLIVIGSPGPGGLFGARWRSLARRSPTPVLIVPRAA